MPAYDQIEADQDQTVEAYRDCWMQTLTGKKLYLLNPQPGQIDIEDIAGALSKMCRFNGHCREFYSVAEHSVLLASKAPLRYKLDALFHDASEAYIADIIRPLKPHMPGYYDKENTLMTVIAKKFGFQWPMCDEVKRLDVAILGTERNAIMFDTAEDAMMWGNTEPPLDVKIHCWAPKTAYIKFMSAYWRYKTRA